MNTEQHHPKRYRVRSDLVNYNVEGSFIGNEPETPLDYPSSANLILNNPFKTPFEEPLGGEPFEDPSMPTEEKEYLERKFSYEPNLPQFRSSNNFLKPPKIYPIKKQIVNQNLKERKTYQIPYQTSQNEWSSNLRENQRNTEGREKDSSSSNFTLIDRTTSQPPYHSSFYKEKNTTILIEENKQLRFLMSDYLKEIDQMRMAYANLRKKYGKVKDDIEEKTEENEELRSILTGLVGQNCRFVVEEKRRSPSQVLKNRRGKRYKSQEKFDKK